MRISRILLCLVLVASASHAQDSVERHESEGNLAPTHDVGCVEISTLSSEYTPADVYPAIRKCIDAEQYQKAVALYALAATYARYDIARVADSTAHLAAQVLMMNAFQAIDEAKSTAFQGVFKATASDPTRMATICKAIRGLGHPTYAPQYMIAHGMGSFVGQDTPDGLVVDFDADAAWEGTLSAFLHCPGA
jgi:hypothetical protein